VTTIAYLANEFPSDVEPYLGDEIQELRGRGIRVIAGSVRRPLKSSHDREVSYLYPLGFFVLLRALALAIGRWQTICGLTARALLWGRESPKRRLKAVLHTWLGACYAVQLRKLGVDHIHVHHGYFGSWIAMVAAELLGVGYSLTLHGSDLLLHGAYLETKLEHCRFCATVSEYNRRFIRQHFPRIDPAKIIVSRLGVDLPPAWEARREVDHVERRRFIMLSVGRLHAVKDHAFLIRACARLRDLGIDFHCAIAGDGPERDSLSLAIHQQRLADRVELLGHIQRADMDSHYRRADIVVLTSRSEGIPLVLMEAMARGRLVLAPAITGIPELVVPGKTGFLYRPGAMNDFIEKVFLLHALIRRRDSDSAKRIDWVRHGARVQVLHNFNRNTNLARFSDGFLQRIARH
jgi:colanic acid/amylovoran biosynthesis glycosyltransferase